MSFVTRKALRTGAVLLIATIPFSLVYGQTTNRCPSAAPCIYDDFDDNTIDPFLWTAVQIGAGPTIAETNHRLEIALPSTSQNGQQGFFGANYTSGACKVRGDFDIQVDYSLLTWPPVVGNQGNGVRVGLLTDVGAMERASLGTQADFSGQPREVYSTDFSVGIPGIIQIPTGDQTGTLKLARVGDVVKGYYCADVTPCGPLSNWIPIHYFTKTADDVGISLMSWSADYAFTDQEVKVAFDNLIVNQGEVICPNTAKLFAVTASDEGPLDAVYRFKVGPTGDPGQPDLTLDNANYNAGLQLTHSIAFSANGELFITNRGNGTSGSGSVSRFLHAGGVPAFNNAGINYSAFSGPHGAVFRGNELFIAQRFGKNVLRFLVDASGNAMYNGDITEGLGGADGARGVAVNPATGDLFVTLCCGVHTINRYVFDANGHATLITPVITGGGLNNPVDMAFSPWGELFVSNSTSPTISRFTFDAAGNALPQLPVGGNGLNGPHGVTFSPWGELFVSSYLDAKIFRWTFDSSSSHNAIPNGSFITPHPLADIEFLSECTPPPSGMISWWPGDENANDIQDGNNGQLRNGATAGAAGKVNGAFDLDGINDHVRISSVTGIDGAQQFTIDAWAFARNVGSLNDDLGPIIVTKDLGDTTTTAPGVSWILFGPGNTNKFTASVRFTDLTDVTVSSTNTFAFNNFHHVAMSWDGGTLKLYVNGQLEGSASVGGKTVIYTGEPVSIGRHNLIPEDTMTPGLNPRAFDGLIDEVEFYNRALSASEIQAIVNAGSAGKCKVTPPSGPVVKLLDSLGSGIAGGLVEYYSGGWHSLGSTDGSGTLPITVAPGNYTFRMTYAFASVQKAQNIGTNPTVVFQTQNAEVQLKNSQGTLIDSGTVDYYSGGWHSFGATSGGRATLELLPTNFTFRMSYAFASVQKPQNVASDPTVIFQTQNAEVQLKDSQGALIDSGVVDYYSGGWHSFGATTGGRVTLELLPTNYTFRMSYAFASVQKPQNIATDPTVIFQTQNAEVQLKDSQGALIDSGMVDYYSGGWHSFGATSGGRVTLELLPTNYTFRMSYAFASVQKPQNIAADPTVIFQTQNADVQLKDSQGAFIDSGTVDYYSGGWHIFGTTSGGRAMLQLLPTSYTFRMTYAFASAQKAQNLAASPTVDFQTGQVDSDSNTGTSYYSGGWRPFTDLMQLLPGTYTFRFNGSPNAAYAIAAGTTNHIQ